MTDSLHAMLAGAIDYAGLFPPASLQLAQTLENCQAYAEKEDGWALGRLIVPAAKLAELVRLEALRTPKLSILLSGTDLEREAETALRLSPQANIFECKVSTLGDIAGVCRSLGKKATVFIEVPLDETCQRWIEAIAAAGACVKIRTGGVTPQAIPESGAVAHFLQVCAQAKVAFKATAGLHHPLRADHALTYAADAPHGYMHGFVNMTLAAMLAWHGVAGEEVCAALNCGDAKDFSLDEGGVRWRGHFMRSLDIAAMRSNFFRSFGSCSFTEPFDDLRSLGWA